MDWTDLKEAVRSLVVAMTALPTEMVVWADEPRPNIDPGDATLILLDLAADQIIGSPVGEFVTEAENKDDPASLAKLVYSTTHTATISIRAESIAQEGSRWAAKWLSQILVRFGWDTHQASLRKAGIAFVDTDPLTRLPDQTIDKRSWSVATINVRLAFVLTETDDGYDGAFINSTSFAGELTL